MAPDPNEAGSQAGDAEETAEQVPSELSDGLDCLSEKKRLADEGVPAPVLDDDSAGFEMPPYAVRRLPADDSAQDTLVLHTEGYPVYLFGAGFSRYHTRDTFVLESRDGSYREQRSAGDATMVNDQPVLWFPDPPDDTELHLDFFPYRAPNDGGGNGSPPPKLAAHSYRLSHEHPSMHFFKR